MCEVVMRYRLRMPSEYCDVTDFAVPTIGATFRVGSLPAGLEFVSSGQSRVSDLPNADNAWHFDRPFVTGQSIRVRWFKKRVLTSIVCLPERRAWKGGHLGYAPPLGVIVSENVPRACGAPRSATCRPGCQISGSFARPNVWPRFQA